MPLKSFLAKIENEIATSLTADNYASTPPQGSPLPNSHHNHLDMPQDNHHMHGGNSGGYGAAHNQDVYQPPPGTPPGHYEGKKGHSSTFPPPQEPPPGPHGGYNAQPNTFAPPPGPPPSQHPSTNDSSYQAPQGAAPGHHPPGPQPTSPQASPLPFPRRMEMWNEYSDSGDTYSCVGATFDHPAYSGKFPMASGRLVMRAGGRKSNNTDIVLGEAVDRGLSRSSARISLASGFSCDLKKNSATQLGKTSYTFTVPVLSGGQETFMWRPDSQDLKSMMKGQSGWSLVRQGDNSGPYATFTDYAGLSMSSKDRTGTLEFVGRGASGELGNIWATVAMIAIVKAKQKQIEKKILKQVMGAT